jgi:N-acetylglucosamine-6-phosphate deacetylase
MTIPRIIDLHTHGVAGVDTRTHEPETVLEIAVQHGLAGVAEIVPTIYPGPIQEMRHQMAAVKAAMTRQQEEGTAIQARILGVHLEGPFLNQSRCGALDPAMFLEPSERAFRGLIEGFEGIVLIVTVAPEKGGAIPLIRLMAGQGIVVSMGHSDATFAEAEAGCRAGARGITHLFDAMRGFHHREPGITGFGLLDRDVYVELIGDLHHLSPGTIDLVLRTKDPRRILFVSDSVKQTQLKSGRPPAGPDGTLLGGGALLPSAVQMLVDKGFDEDLVSRSVSLNPTEYLNG